MSAAATDTLSAPGLDDARRAAEALVAAGAAEVWLYGSLARAEAHEYSDIDLVAVLADLEYRQRLHVTCELRNVAREACGHWVEVMVTDLAEWHIQREQVPSSFISAISDDLMLLASCPDPPDAVDWDKEQVMATSDEELAQERLAAALMNLQKFDANLEPGPTERELADSDDRLEHAEQLGARLIDLCEAAQLVVENAAKALAVLEQIGAQRLWTHDVAEVVGALDDEHARALGALMSADPSLVKSPDYVTMWRTRGAYGTPTEGMTAQEVATPAFTSRLALIACDVAGYVADTARQRMSEPDVAARLHKRAAATRDRLTAYEITTGKPRETPP